jgi:hypothetical protein
VGKVLKWFPATVGVILFITGLALKIAEKPSSYDDFIAGNSYILLALGIEAIILNLAFNIILKNGEDSK